MTTDSTNSILEAHSSDIAFQFGDLRINRRANFMVEKMTHSCQKPLSQAFSTSADLKGAYRFLDNNLVTPEKILKPHFLETIKRCKSQQFVAVLQDSSDLDYSYMECLEGFTPLHTNLEKGYRIHPSLVITEEGTPLGILSTTNYTREISKLQKKHRNSLPIEKKESYRWLLGYREACKLSQETGIQVVSISDKEGDIYECLAEAKEINDQNKAAILVRSNHNRSLAAAIDDTDNKLEKKLTRASVICTAKILLNKYKTNERKALVALRASKVLIQAPNTCKKKSLPPIEINAVLVSEIDPPKGEKPIYWLLLTTLPIDTQEDILRVVSLYSKRWCIEIFFKVLKSGCKIDSPRLQSTPSIENFVALALIVGWKVMLVTYLPREYPDEPCTVIFSMVEWKLAYRGAYPKNPIPEKVPTLKEAVVLVAMLGGYQKRKDPPGIQTVWRGVVRLMDMVYGYELTQGIALSQ